jgi:hypothetical protein
VALGHEEDFDMKGVREARHSFYPEDIRMVIILSQNRDTQTIDHH